MFKIIASLLFLICISSNVHAENPLIPNLSGKFNLGALNLYIECYGKGTPSIIVNSGFGGAGSDGGWEDVIKVISSKNQICFYDRANLGKSDKFKDNYDLNTIVEQLHKLLYVADIAPPYLMVGHSYGSYPIKLFNHLYPDEVAGILLVDPSLYGMFSGNVEKWNPDDDKYDKSMQERMNAEFAGWHDPEQNAEKINMKSSAKLIQKSSDFGNKPFVLLWAKNAIWKGGEAPDDWHPAVWNRMKKLYSNDMEKMHSLSTDMKIVFANTPQHNIFYYEPDSVIKAINDLLEK